MIALCCLAGALFLGPARAEEGWWAKVKGYVGGPKEAVAPPLGPDQVVYGLKVTLNAAADHATRRLGHYDGFAAASDVRIMLPPNFEKARRILDRFGLSGRFENLELQMNRAAENATPALRPLIGRAIEAQVFQNPGSIAAGPPDAATRAFERAREADLIRASKPVIEKSLAEAGAEENLRIIRQTLKALPMGPELKFDMTAYVTDKTLDGLFQYMAEREGEIRKNSSLSQDQIVRRLFPG